MSFETRKWMALARAAVLAAAGLHAVPAAAVDTDMAISTTAIDFGAVKIGSTAQATVTLTNTGGDPFGPITLFGGAPPTAEFNASQNCQGSTLPAGGSCLINYAFTPGAPGAHSDSSSFTLSETNSQSDGEDFSVSLVGTGTECQLLPSFCELIDLPTFELQPLEPPPAPSFALSLEGTARVKGSGFKTRGEYALQLNVDTDALTFLAMDADGTLYGGHLVAKNQKGDKFALFLDDASDGPFATDIAARAAEAAGQANGTALGGSAQLTFKRKADGSVSLRIQSTVLVSGIGEVAFTAKLVGE